MENTPKPGTYRIIPNNDGPGYLVQCATASPIVTRVPYLLFFKRTIRTTGVVWRTVTQHGTGEKAVFSTHGKAENFIETMYRYFGPNK